MASDTIFAKIVSGEIPTELVLQTERVIAFHDIAPQAPVHLLVIPKTGAYDNVHELAAGDPSLLAEMVEVARQLAAQHGNGDYRLVFNSGATAGQTVFHVHAHVLIGEFGEQGLVGE